MLIRAVSPPGKLCREGFYWGEKNPQLSCLLWIFMPRASSERDGFGAGQRALLRPVPRLDTQRLWLSHTVGEDGCGVFLFALNVSRWCKGLENRKRQLQRRLGLPPTCGAEIIGRVFLFEITPVWLRVCWCRVTTGKGEGKEG